MADVTGTSKIVSPFMFEEELDVVVPVARQTRRNWMADGKFPSPVRLGPARVAWLRDEVLAWVESRKADRVSYKSFA